MAPKRATRSNIAPETTNTTSVTNAQLQAMINQGVTAALAARDANTNGVDSHNSGTSARRNERATRECTYPDFMKCQPLNFKGTKGVFSTCTLLGNALTWWNSHVRTVGNDIAYAMTWAELKKKMTDKYCPRTEIKKLEVELWELKVKGTDVIGYNQHFQELALLCGRMFPEESDKIEKYVGGLPDMIHGSVVASKPKTMQKAIEMATEVMDKRISTFADCQTENMRKQDDNQQQQQSKRQNTSRAYTAGTVEKKPYEGSKPLCSKCNYHHDGPCAPKCHKYNKINPILEEFTGELAHIAPILSGIVEADPDDDTLSDDDDFEDIEYVSFEEVNDFDQEEKEFIRDFLQFKTLNLSFHFDNPSFSRPSSEPPNVEICLHFEPDAPMIDNFDMLNNDEPFDQGEGENVIFLNDERQFITLPFVLFSHLSPTPRPLLYLAPPGVKTLSLTTTSPLRAGGISFASPWTT
ncbi:putative reverse transcriptase domain-containing protein [Tanacetum coccineum]